MYLHGFFEKNYNSIQPVLNTAYVILPQTEGARILYDEVILEALENLPENVSPSLHFGNGKSAALFLKHLQDSVFWNTGCQKQFKDLNLTSLLKN